MTHTPRTTYPLPVLMEEETRRQWSGYITIRSKTDLGQILKMKKISPNDSQ